MCKFFLSFSVIFFCSGQYLFSQTNDINKVSTFEWQLSYVCDAGRNFTGGLKKGNAYMGLVFAGVTINSEKLWKGGSLTIQGMNTHGYNLSENYVGDMQVISNIENGDYTFLENLFYRQDFSKLSLLAGLQDLNAEFCVSEYGGALTNSSFGIQSTFPLNFGTPLYPKTALAFSVFYTIRDIIFFRASAWDGNAGSLDDDPHNLDWVLSKDDGLLTVEELEYRLDGEKLTDVKLGFLYHSAEFVNAEDDSITLKGNTGFYAIVDKQLLSSGTRSLGVFGQFASFPSKANCNTMYIGGGLNYSGLFTKRPDDCFATGFAYSKFCDDTFECDLELNYRFIFGSHIDVQPAFHYVIHPGANQKLDNAFAGFMRIYLTL